MKTKLEILHPVAAAMFLLASAGLTTASAQMTVVDFTGYTANDVDLLDDNSGADRPLDLSTVRLGSGDFSTAPDSPNVYAGSVGDQGRVFDTSSGAEWGVNADRVAFLWQKADFLNGGDSQTVSLDASSEFTVTWGGRPGGESTSMQTRWLILTGGNLYVSDETFNLDSAGTQQTNTSGSFTTMQWAQMDLDTSMNATMGSFSSIAVSDIDGAGVLIDTPDDRYFWESFTADATVIPEPSTFALLAGAFGLTLVMVRRRRS